MAQVDIEEVIDHLSSEMRKALVIAVNDVIPGADYDERQLFKAFRKAVRRKCNTWEQVPDQYVRD